MNDAASRRRAAIGPSANPQGLTREELRRLAKAERKIATLDARQAESGRQEILDLERRRTERLEGRDLAARLAETASLARARGEEVRSETLRIAVPLVDEHGAPLIRRGLSPHRQEVVTRVRIMSRGGLELAFERGDLDGGPTKAERLLETARTYRWAYEVSIALTTPQRVLSVVSRGSTVRASGGPQEQVFRAGELLRLFRDGLTARQIAVLDRVCGCDMTVRAAALSLKADPRSARKALHEGLTLADANRATTPKTGRVTESAIGFAESA